MPYPEALVQPMRAELTRLGVEELKDGPAVDAFLDRSSDGTALLVINSVCGCAAAMARPAVAMALNAGAVPDHLGTVFAGQDLEATARAREHLAGIPPSSPFIALLQHGDPVFLLERRHIEGRSAAAIATDLVQAFAHFCGDGQERSEVPAPPAPDRAPPADLPPTFRSIL